MRSIRYLNTVLTVIAMLLTLQLWTLWTSPPAQTLSAAQMAHARGRPAGFPNAAAQRM